MGATGSITTITHDQLKNKLGYFCLFFESLDFFSEGEKIKAPRGYAFLKKEIDPLYEYQENKKPNIPANLKKLKESHYWTEIYHNQYGSGILFIPIEDVKSMFSVKRITYKQRPKLRTYAQFLVDLVQYQTLYYTEDKDNLIYSNVKEEVSYLIETKPKSKTKSKVARSESGSAHTQLLLSI